MQTLSDTTTQCARTEATCTQSNNTHSPSYQPNAITFCDVAICGGGLGGLALAVGLRGKGYDAHVFEAAPKLRTGTSTMIALNNNAFMALAGLHPDLVPELKAQGAPLVRIIKQDKQAASESYDYKTSGESYTMRWAMVQNVLSCLLPPEAVHCNHRASGYKEDADKGLVQVNFKDQPAIQARLLVCADGLRSALRQVMIPNDPGPRRMAEAGAGYTYWSTWIESESSSFTNKSGPGQGIPGIKARVEDILSGAGLDDVLKVVQATPESGIFERALLDRIPLDELGATMVSPGGRVVLLGDAAHAMHPHPGQGARMAFEDADTLIRCLDQHREDLIGWASADAQASDSLHDHSGLKAALAAYNTSRLSRVCRIQRYAAEYSGVPALLHKLALTSSQRAARDTEFLKWTYQYPNNAAGDPSSQFWKPHENGS